MRRSLGTLLPALVLLATLGTSLAGCGDDSGSAADAPASTGTSSSSAGPVDFTLLDTITVTAAGGTVSPEAVPLDDDAAVVAFVKQFSAGDLPTQVQGAVDRADVPDGQRLYGAVVAVGCDAPDQVTVTRTADGLAVTAVAVASPTPECFAAMTTVALVLVPA